MSKLSAVVIGDVMVDYLVRGVSTRMAPEAPVPVFTPKSTDVLPGGAANVAANLAAMGVKTLLIGAVGRDSAGRDLEHACSKVHDLHVRLVVGNDSTTVTRTRYAVNSSYLLRVDSAGTLNVNAAEVLQTLTQALDSGEVNVVVVADYGRGTMQDISFQLVGLCAKYKVPLIVDAKPACLQQYAGASLVKVNLSEAAEYVSSWCGHLAMLYDDVSSQAEVVAKKMLEQLRTPVVIVTTGEHGAVVVCGNYAASRCGVSVVAVDTTGAGDTFLAAITRQFGLSATLSEAVDWANLASSIAVGRMGTAVVSLGDVAEQKASQPPGVITHDEAIALVKKWKDEGDTVVFTNGCFDLFHAGHMSLLRTAGSMGRRLVVAVDSDESVRAAKGADRPRQTTAQRAESVSYYADAVVVFNGRELDSLVSRMLPSVLVKGAEYEGKRVVGADAVLADGGHLRFVEMVPDISTTAIIASTKQEV